MGAGSLALVRLLRPGNFCRLYSERTDHQIANGAVTEMAGTNKDAKNRMLRMMSSSVSNRAYLMFDSLWTVANSTMGLTLTSAD